MIRVLSFSIAGALGACSGGAGPASPGQSTGKAPTSDQLVAMVRTSKLPNACGSSEAATLGAEYAAQAKTMQTSSKEMSVAFVERGDCKPASAHDSGIANAVPEAAWYCTVSASPDWDKVKKQPGEEEGGTNFSVGFALDSGGTIVAKSVHCVAAG
jgi:hypothetical protein